MQKKYEMIVYIARLRDSKRKSSEKQSKVAWLANLKVPTDEKQQHSCATQNSSTAVQKDLQCSLTNVSPEEEEEKRKETLLFC